MPSSINLRRKLKLCETLQVRKWGIVMWEWFSPRLTSLLILPRAMQNIVICEFSQKATWIDSSNFFNCSVWCCLSTFVAMDESCVHFRCCDASGENCSRMERWSQNLFKSTTDLAKSSFSLTKVLYCPILFSGPFLWKLAFSITMDFYNTSNNIWD